MEISIVISIASIAISIATLYHKFSHSRNDHKIKLFDQQFKMLELRRIFVGDTELQEIFYDIEYDQLIIELGTQEEKIIDKLMVFFDTVCMAYFASNQRMNMTAFDYYLKSAGTHEGIQSYISHITSWCESRSVANPFSSYLTYLTEILKVKISQDIESTLNNRHIAASERDITSNTKRQVRPEIRTLLPKSDSIEALENKLSIYTHDVAFKHDFIAKLFDVNYSITSRNTSVSWKFIRDGSNTLFHFEVPTGTFGGRTIEEDDISKFFTWMANEGGYKQDGTYITGKNLTHLGNNISIIPNSDFRDHPTIGSYCYHILRVSPCSYSSHLATALVDAGIFIETRKNGARTFSVDLSRWAEIRSYKREDRLIG